MDYYINRLLPVAFDEAVARTKEALKAEGFGVLTEINVRETLKAKIDEASLLNKASKGKRRS